MTTTADTLTPVTDDAVAELAALHAETALHVRARDTVLAQIEAMRVADILPIEAALQEFAAREKAVRARLAMAEYNKLGLTDDQRATAFSAIQLSASAARFNARNSPGGSQLSRVIEAVWDRAMTKWQESGNVGVFGSAVYSPGQRNADHLEMFRDLTKRLTTLASLSVAEKISMADSFEVSRINGGALPI